MDPRTDDVSYSSRDPTRTLTLRQSLRRLAQLKLNGLRATLRQHVVDRDCLGLAPNSVLSYHPAHVRLEAFNAWFSCTAEQLLIGRWMEPSISKAWQSGERAARIEVRSADVRTSTDPSQSLFNLTVRELAGIAAVIQQQVGREALKAARQKNPAAAWRLLAKAFDKASANRLNALANVMVVKAHNQAKVAVYRAAGIGRVGVIPEMLPFLPVHDAKRKSSRYIEEPIDVGIRTAGDDKVCAECADYAAHSPYDLDQVEDDLPLHVNCRCTWFPWDDRRFRRD